MDRIDAMLDAIPGYAGYQDKERRRDSDRRLRESIANQLESITQRVERAGTRLAAERKLESASQVESLARSIGHAANLVRTQSYGYGGIFTDTPVDERALNQLYLFDKGLALKVDQLDAQLAGVEAGVVNDETLRSTIEPATRSLQALIDFMGTRGAVLETATAASPRSLFEPLGAEAAPPPAIDIDVGDAIAWFDDDYLINARIVVRDGEQRVSMYRLDAAPERWLVVADGLERMLAIVEESAEAGIPEAGSTPPRQWQIVGPGETTMTDGKRHKADASVTLQSEEMDTGNVQVWLQSGADERYFTGRRVHPDDLSLYGKPAKT